MPYTMKPDEVYGLDIENTDYLKDHVQAPDRWVLNFGPQHPATHTTLRLVLELPLVLLDAVAHLLVLEY